MRRLLLLIALALPGIALAENLEVKLPAGMKVTTAVAAAPEMKLSSRGEVRDGVVHFAKLLPATSYDLTLTLSDGRVLQGVNLGWRSEEAVDPVKNPMTDDDRAAIHELVQPGKDFFNKIDILLLAGDHDRATALVKQIRDRAFHSDKGDEVISRYELWYFRFEYGGWEKVQQGSKVLRRDRFPTHAAFEKTIGPIRWVPALGGITLDKGKDRTLTLQPSDLPAEPSTTQPTK
jgi:hypothetical protein